MGASCGVSGVAIVMVAEEDGRAVAGDSLASRCVAAAGSGGVAEWSGGVRVVVLMAVVMVVTELAAAAGRLSRLMCDWMLGLSQSRAPLLDFDLGGEVPPPLPADEEGRRCIWQKEGQSSEKKRWCKVRSVRKFHMEALQ